MAVWSITNTVEITKNKRFDSEFFHPDYLISEDKVINSGETRKLGELGRFLIGPFGSAFHVSNYDSTSKYRYIRGKDVKPFALLDDDNVYMPEKDYNRLVKYAVSPRDLLISVVGTLGNVAIVPEKINGIFSCKSTVFRDSTIDPYYLLAYFNCKYGHDVLLRRQRGAIQSGLNKEDLKTVPVPIFSTDEHRTIGELIRNSLEFSEKSISLYNKAQEILEKELGMDELVLEKPKSYETNFSEVVGNSRVDADFFQTKYKQVEQLCTNHNNIKLHQISTPIETGRYASSYTENGQPYIRGVDINKNGFIDSNNVLNTNSIIINNKTTVRTNDILVTRVGSIGTCAIVHEEFSGSFYSDNLIRIRVKPPYINEISPFYLLLLLTGEYGQMQMTRYSRGSVQQRLNQRQLSQISIPIINFEKQQEIDNLIQQHLMVKKESDQLLEQAKNRVEGLIEGVIKQ